MNWIGVLRLTILLALLLADSPISLAAHAHETYDETVSCAVCSFVASSTVLTGQPDRILPATGPAELVPPASELSPDTSCRVAKRTRAPPAPTS
jgi:hypothetical protein